MQRTECDSHLRRYLWGGHFRSDAYFAEDCGGPPPTVVEQYIDNQKRPACLSPRRRREPRR
ncbi:transposase [Streptomyces zhihengii]|uniref:transposase n=1 Tax=Streptomyces zhihengii TaxID=1818004 RepID=UPI00362BF67A